MVEFMCSQTQALLSFTSTFVSIESAGLTREVLFAIEPVPYGPAN